MFAMDDIDENIPSIVMTKPPAVSDFASTLSSVIATASSQHSEAIEEPVTVRAGISDVLWKPPRLSRSRTCSTDSADFEYSRSVSTTASPIPIEEPKGRRFSLSEMIFGSPNKFSASVPIHSTITEGEAVVGRVRNPSVTEDERFKDILRNQDAEPAAKRF